MESNYQDQLKQSLMNSISKHQGFGNYQVGSQISRGAYGHIFQLRNRIDNKVYVLKVLQAKNKNQLKRIKSQIKIQRNLKSRYIVNLIKDFKDNANDNISATFYYMILDFCQKGDLHKYLIKNYPNGLQFNQLHSFSQQIARGISYLHKNKIVHGDIKSSNILVTQNNQLKICDFGFAEVLNEDQKLKQNRGTLTHMAPQTIHQYDNKADIWAFGVLLFQLATGSLPFCIKSMKDLPQLLQNKTIQNYKYPGKLSYTLIDLLKHIFVCDPNKRYSINQVLNHAFFTGQVIDKVDSQQLQPRKFKSYTSAVLISRKQRDQCNKMQKKQIKHQNNHHKVTDIDTKNGQQNKSGQFLSKNKQTQRVLSHKTMNYVQRNHQNKQNNKNSDNVLQKKLGLYEKKEIVLYESSQFKAKRKSSPLNTQHMIIKPIQKNNSIINIDLNGITKITQQVSKENKKTLKTVNIDCAGRTMSIKLNSLEKTYNFQEIPQKYWRQYQNCKTIVNLTKQHTPKMIFNKNQHPNSIQIQVMHSGKIIAKINTLEIVTNQAKLKSQSILNMNEKIVKQYYTKLINI